MSILTPLEALFDAPDADAQNREIALPPALAHLYGHLHLPLHSERTHVIGNFVTTLDGVVSLSKHGSGGGDISGNNNHDHAVMGLLRALADAIIVGAGTLRDARLHRWTAPFIFPPLADAYQTLRTTLHKTTSPLTVIVTAHGDLDPTLPLFQDNETPVLVVSTTQGVQNLRTRGLPTRVQIVSSGEGETVSAQAVLAAVHQVHPCELVLVEGGPHLLGDFFAEHCLNEQFLTLAPQIAGRDHTSNRPGLVADKLFAPTQPLWGSLVSVKRAENHLFLRYAF